MVGRSASKVIHWLAQILASRRVHWTRSDRVVTSMHGDGAELGGLGGEMQLGGGESGDAIAEMVARVTVRMALGRSWLW